MANDTRIGLIGELHPLVTAAWDLGLTSAWTINLDILAGSPLRSRATTPSPAFPVARGPRGCPPETVSAADAIAAIREAGGPDLTSVAVFDRYHGDQISSGNVSLAFHLEFQSPDPRSRAKTSERVGKRSIAR